MAIQGLGERSTAQLRAELQEGARFVVYQYCVSLIFVTLRQSSDVQYIAPGQSRATRGARWTVLTAIAGWWGIPWGPIYSIRSMATNFAGGKDVTLEVMTAISQFERENDTTQAETPLASRVARRASLRSDGALSVDVLRSPTGEIRFAAEPLPGGTARGYEIALTAAETAQLNAALDASADQDLVSVIQRHSSAITAAGGELPWLRSLGIEPQSRS